MPRHGALMIAGISKAADVSLDRLGRLAASLLDMNRLQAGKLSVFPRPAPLRVIIARA